MKVICPNYLCYMVILIECKTVKCEIYLETYIITATDAQEGQTYTKSVIQNNFAIINYYHKSNTDMVIYLAPLISCDPDIYVKQSFFPVINSENYE